MEPVQIEDNPDGSSTIRLGSHVHPAEEDSKMGRGIRLDIRKQGEGFAVSKVAQIGSFDLEEPPFEQRVSGIVLPASGARQKAMEILVSPLASFPTPVRRIVKDIRNRLPKPKEIRKDDYDFRREVKRYYNDNVKNITSYLPVKK